MDTELMLSNIEKLATFLLTDANKEIQARTPRDDGMPHTFGGERMITPHVETQYHEGRRNVAAAILGYIQKQNVTK